TAYAHGEVDTESAMSNHLWFDPATIIGLPALSVPLGLARDGLPAGVQVHGPLYLDSTPVAFAQALERKGLAGFRPPES
ncbi:MAG: hypothetical protein AAF658_20185, partial [Myxococcota bacterium]